MTRPYRILHLLGATALLGLPAACKPTVDRATFESLEAEVAQLQEKLAETEESAKPKLDEAQAKLDDLAAKKEQLEGMRTERSRLREEIRAAEKELAAASETFEDYRRRYRAYIRRTAQGTRLDSVPLVDGTELKNVEVSSLSATQISLKVPSGIRTIELALLPIELRQKLGFDPDEAAQASAAPPKPSVSVAVAPTLDPVAGDNPGEYAARRAKILSIEKKMLSKNLELEKLIRAKKIAETRISQTRAMGPDAVRGTLKTLSQLIKAHETHSNRITQQILKIEDELDRLRLEMHDAKHAPIR